MAEGNKSYFYEVNGKKACTGAYIKETGIHILCHDLRLCI